MSTSKFEKDVEDDNDEALLRTTASSDNPDDEIVSITTGAHMTEDLLSTPRASPIERLSICMDQLVCCFMAVCMSFHVVTYCVEVVSDHQ